MLLNITLKRVVDFHGHLCPDLVLGCKLCEYIQKLLFSGCEMQAGISIIAENCTSALDAIQIILGATVGNNRLHIVDFGKHSYTISSKTSESGFRLSLRQRYYGDENEYDRLEQKISDNQVMLEEVVHFQKLLDSRVRHLLDLSPEKIFTMEHIKSANPQAETANVLLTCSRCGEQVLKNRKIDFQGNVYCIPCFQRINKSCIYHNLQ